jgi:hypothetical protein
VRETRSQELIGSILTSKESGNSSSIDFQDVFMANNVEL